MQSSNKSFFEMLDQAVQRHSDLPKTAFHTIQEPQYLSWMIGNCAPITLSKSQQGLKVYAQYIPAKPLWEEICGDYKVLIERFNRLAEQFLAPLLCGPRDRLSLRKCYRALLLKVHPDQNPGIEAEHVSEVIKLYRKIDKALFRG